MSKPPKPAATAPKVDKPSHYSVKDEPYLVVKTVVGEVMPVALDVQALRERCFPAAATSAVRALLGSSSASSPSSPAPSSSSGSAVPSSPYRETEDAIALHVVAYLNLTALEAYIEQYAEFAKARSSVGLSNLRFQGQLPEPPQVYIDEAKAILAKGPAVKRQTTIVPPHIAAAVADGTQLAPVLKKPDPTKKKPAAPGASTAVRYVPDRLHPIGSLRLRRVSQCRYLGRFHMMIATVEWQCVLEPYRNTGVGGAMIFMAERAAKEAFHVPYIYLFSPLRARPFYENHGYVIQLVPPKQKKGSSTSKAEGGKKDSTELPEVEPVKPCGTNVSQCIAAGWTPRMVDIATESYIVMGKSLSPANADKAKSNL